MFISEIWELLMHRRTKSADGKFCCRTQTVLIVSAVLLFGFLLRTTAHAQRTRTRRAWDDDTDWWVERAAYFFQPFEFTLPSTAPDRFALPPQPDAERDWGNAGTDFNSGANWVGGIAPGLSDVAWFKTAETVQPNLSASLSIAGLY